MLKRQKKLPPLFIEQLEKEKDVYVIATLLQAIGEVGSPENVALLSKYLGHDDARVRAKALEFFVTVIDAMPVISYKGYYVIIPLSVTPGDIIRNNTKGGDVMENPFRYGGVVTGPYFADREKEKEQLEKDIANHQNIFIISPRRYGKTSLIWEVLTHGKPRNSIKVYLDFYKVTSKADFIEKYSRAIAQNFTSTIDKLQEISNRFLSRILPKITISHDGAVDVEFEFSRNPKSVNKLLEEVIEVPQQIALKEQKPVCVVFDEFQEIENLNGDRFEKELRSHLQHHSDVSYVFMGSKRQVMLHLLKNRKSPLFNMGKLLPLEKIDRAKYERFISNHFKKTGFPMKPRLVAQIIDSTDNHPFYTQMLAHEVWNLAVSESIIDQNTVGKALLQILNNFYDLFLRLWETLSLHQRRTLLSIVRSGGANVYSNEFIVENYLGATSSVQKSISYLEQKEIIDRENGEYIVLDPLFKRWLERYMEA